MKVVAYTRISTDAQDLDKQKHLLLAYAQQQKLMIDEFIEVTISSRESPRERKIDVLLEKLHAGDTLLVAELSRLGRNMLETLGIINTLSEQGIKVAQRAAWAEAIAIHRRTAESIGEQTKED